MSAGIILCLETQSVIATRAVRANSFGARARGLLFRTRLDPEEALVLPRCTMVHMFFMQFAIDVAFLDETNRIIRLVPNLRPWRMSPNVSLASQAVELSEGTIARSNLALGQHLSGFTLSSPA